jgi:hypothetical protein
LKNLSGKGLSGPFVAITALVSNKSLIGKEQLVWELAVSSTEAGLPFLNNFSWLKRSFSLAKCSCM